MPWRDASPMDQRTQFIADHLRDALPISELCELYGVSRKTGYKWIDRYVRHGPAGLEERSRRPRRSPRQTSDEIVTAILDARRRHPRWGGKKLLALLHKRHPGWDLPGRSTACDILSRHGMVPIKRQRRRIGHPGRPTSQILAPNDVWSADYKGQFRTGEKAERKLKWYETHQIKAERQAIYVGCGFLLLGIITLLVRWGMSGH